jgi:predicted permease
VPRAAERVSTAVVSPDYFDVLGVRPISGRSLRDSDDRPGAPAVLLLSHAYWTRAFNRDPAIVGRVFEMNDRPHTVVGVLPPLPAYPEAVDVYMPTSACPFRSRPGAASSRNMRMSRAIVRTDQDVSPDRIDAALGRAAARLRAQYPESYGDEPYSAFATPLDVEMRRSLKPTLVLLAATAGLVLLIACVSVSNLALARLTHRYEEVALRAALGAARGRIVRQLLTENVAAVLPGLALGLAAAQVVVAALTGYVQRSTALEVDRHLNGAAFVAATIVSVMLLFVSAAIPLFKQRHAMVGGLPRLRPGRVRYGLVVGQVGLSFVLTIAAALSVRSLLHLQGIDAGFSTEHVQTMRVDLNFTKYDSYPAITAFWRRLEGELTAIPGVVSAGGAGTVPLDGQPLGSSTFTLEGPGSAANVSPDGPDETARGLPRASLRVASAGYFAALGQRLVEGRTFLPDDESPASPASPGRAVVVINQTLARRHWPGTTAVGGRLRFDGSRTTMTVVGVVDDTRQKLDQPPQAEMYLPLLQTRQLATNWLVRSSLPPEEVERRARAIVRGIDAEQPVDNFRALESFRADSLLPSRVTATVVGLFSVLTLAITTTGIAGVLGYAVQQRRREFGVRLALGAQRSRVVAMVVGDGIRLAAIGLAWGAAASLALAPLMPEVLSGTDSFDATNFALVSLVLLLAAAAACFVPARRAAHVDPLLALRSN